MLHLAAPTRPDWAPQAIAALDTVLVDHAHCEKKAASMALTLLFRYPDQRALLRPLSALAREELEHFEQLLELLDARGVPFAHLPPAPYAASLLKACRRDEPGRLVDTLLCCALIEARSCERMRLLSEQLPDPELAAFYKGLLATEARHHMLYFDLAAEIAGRAEARGRLDALAAHEAEVLLTPGPEPRMHA
jgi:tRNA-(ms[2]io[6]A)-hydroxylase